MLSNLIFKFLQTGLIGLAVRTANSIALILLLHSRADLLKQHLYYGLEHGHSISSLSGIGLPSDSDIVLLQQLTNLVVDNPDLQFEFLLSSL
jgi:hypothetical protein